MLPGTAIFRLRQFAELLSRSVAARQALYLRSHLPPLEFRGKHPRVDVLAVLALSLSAPA
jgi:hypothetical protein